MARFSKDWILEIAEGSALESVYEKMGNKVLGKEEIRDYCGVIFLCVLGLGHSGALKYSGSELIFCSSCSTPSVFLLLYLSLGMVGDRGLEIGKLSGSKTCVYVPTWKVRISIMNH
ncbi:hypothetical protein ACMFMG_003930 [Clarireedia jacksonii]